MNSIKLSQFLLKLIKLTSNKDIEWSASIPADIELVYGEVILDKVYETEVNGSKFRLYRYKSKVYTDEDVYYWSERIRFQLIDNYGNTSYEFEYDNSMNDLYDIVREQSSKVLDIIDSILGINFQVLEASYYSKNKSLDVTNEITEKVKNNTLTITADNNIATDPDPGYPKKLKVKYSYNGEVLEAIVNEKQVMILP